MRDKWHSQSVVVIPNGVDPPPPKPPTAGIRVLSLARLAPEKRVNDLVSAFALVARDRDEATLTIAGIGPEEERLRCQVQASAMTDRVTFAGFVDATAALDAADVVVQLSVWENCSYTLLDAVGHGLGVVASPVGGNSEILPRGCLVEAGDHGQVARRIVEQGTDLSTRPRLPNGWPTTTSMAALIAEAYRGLPA
jgi:glycosyltransferase involved in cell wall biosynthesis